MKRIIKRVVIGTGLLYMGGLGDTPGAKPYEVMLMKKDHTMKDLVGKSIIRKRIRLVAEVLE